METYILRIYRRDEDGPESLVGLLETPGDERPAPFRTRRELWSLLNLPPAPCVPEQRVVSAETMGRTSSKTSKGRSRKDLLSNGRR